MFSTRKNKVEIFTDDDISYIRIIYYYYIRNVRNIL